MTEKKWKKSPLIPDAYEAEPALSPSLATAC